MENIFQLMAASRSGAAGLSAASHVVEDISVVLVHATTPDQHMVDEAAGGWEELLNHGYVTHITA